MKAKIVYYVKEFQEKYELDKLTPVYFEKTDDYIIPTDLGFIVTDLKNGRNVNIKKPSKKMIEKIKKYFKLGD